MKAWEIRDNCEEKAVIIFHDHGLAARRMGAVDLGLDFDEVYCERSPKYDKYNGNVPIKNLIKDHGWWFECWHCYSKIHEDMYDFEKVVYASNAVYCSPECQKALNEKIEKINSDAEEFYISLVNAWCKWDIKKFEGGWPLLNPTARINFPGAEFGGSVTVRGTNKSEFQLYIASVDLEKYYEWDKSYSIL